MSFQFGDQVSFPSLTHNRGTVVGIFQGIRGARYLLYMVEWDSGGRNSYPGRSLSLVPPLEQLAEVADG